MKPTKATTPAAVMAPRGRANDLLGRLISAHATPPKSSPQQSPRYTRSFERKMVAAVESAMKGMITTAYSVGDIPAERAILLIQVFALVAS